MELGLDREKLERYKAQAVKLLGHPAKMRVAVVVAMTGLAIGVIYMPLSDRIVEQRKLIAAEKKRLNYIVEIETLRKEAERYTSRIDAHSDTNEWVQYLLDGSREARVRLRDMQAKEPRKVGPYKAVSLALEIEGKFPQLRSFLEWLEQSDRLLRVEMVRMERMPDTLTMKIHILGLMHKKDA